MTSVFTSDWIVLRDVGGDAPPLSETAVAAKAVRDMLMSRWYGPIPEWLSGHRPDGSRSLQPHLAIVPLADVGRPRSTGRLLGMALVLPNEPTLQGQLSLFVDREFVDGIELRLGALGVWDLTPSDERSRTTTLAAYYAAATTWASVTPLVLDRHPAPQTRDSEIRSMIRNTCENIGLPRPEIDT